MLNYLKSKPIILIIIVVVVMLGIILFFELRKPPTTLPVAEVEIVNSFETELDSTALPTGTISVSRGMNYINNFREEVSIHTYTPSVLTDDYIKSANDTLGVVETKRQTIEGAGEITSSTKEYKTLNIYKDMGVLIYSETQEYDPSIDYTFDSSLKVEDYRKKAEEFMGTLNIDMNKYQLKSTRYLSYPASEMEPVISPSTAGVIEFTYIAQTDEIPIIDSTTLLSPEEITILIDKNFVVRRVNASDIGTVGNETAKLKAKNILELKDSIANGEAELIESSFGPDVKILYTTVESAELMYYATDDRLIPVYVVSARLVSESGAEGTGKLIIKAF